MQHRTTPERITRLKSNEVFVFGSSMDGYRVAGAGYDARKLFGAQYGVGVGMTGQCYCLPTKGFHRLPYVIESIRRHVQRFILFAKAHPEQTFLVTRVGCGIVGYTPQDIAPLFKRAKNVSNIHLPAAFWHILN